MAVAREDITIYQGATFSYPIQLDVDENSTPLDLTGCTITGKIRPTYDSPTVIAEFTVTVTTPSSGALILSLSPTTTAAIPVNPSVNARRTLTQYLYDVEVVYSDNVVERILEGFANLSPEVTR